MTVAKRSTAQSCGTSTLPSRQTRERSLRRRSTIITFSARSFSLAASSARERLVLGGRGAPRARALDRAGLDPPPSQAQEALGRRRGDDDLAEREVGGERAPGCPPAGAGRGRAGRGRPAARREALRHVRLEDVAGEDVVDHASHRGLVGRARVNAGRDPRGARRAPAAGASGTAPASRRTPCSRRAAARARRARAGRLSGSPLEMIAARRAPLSMATTRSQSSSSMLGEVVRRRPAEPGTRSRCRPSS